MSLVRAILRNRIVACLKGTTIAGSRVFDSRIDAIPTDNVDNVLPVIAVYTDNDRAKNLSLSSPEGQMKRTIDVQFEISLAQYLKNPDGDDPLVGVLETDAQAELILDLFELQVRRQLQGPTPAAIALQDMIKGYESRESIPGRWPDGNQKISARTITAQIWVADDCAPIWDGVPNPETANPLADVPYLTGILETIATVEAFSSMRDMLGEIFGTAELPPVNRINKFYFTVDVVKPDGTVDQDHQIEFNKTFT